MAVLCEAAVCKYGRVGIGAVYCVKIVTYVEWVMGLFGLDADVATEECCCELCQGGRVRLGCGQQYNMGIGQEKVSELLEKRKELLVGNYVKYKQAIKCQ